jgi:ribonucleoside-diphosphate reductase alpha chain
MPASSETSIFTAPSRNGSTPHFEHYRVIRRDGRNAPFLPDKIAVAISKAFLAAQEQHEELSTRAKETVAQLTADVVAALTRRRPDGGEFHIEDIQDQVELALMRAGEHAVARRYVLYREERAKARAAQAAPGPVVKSAPQVLGADGVLAPLDVDALQRQLEAACAGLEYVNVAELREETLAGLYDGIPQSEVLRAAIMAARARIETAPEYAFVAARLLLDELCAEVLPQPVTHAQAQADGEYSQQFSAYIQKGVAAGRLAPTLLEFDLQKIAVALAPERDRQFAYMGLQTLYDRYLIHIEGRRIELPQWFWMRVAMGLAQREIDREARAIEFYEIISQFRFVPSTPTLFNSGTAYPQLSSCYLTTIGDDLSEIYDAIRDNALLSKFSGGLGNDWTPVRALGARINSTNGQSQGIVPFLKVANDTAVAVNQGGKRQGAV